MKETSSLHQLLDALYRTESRKVLATLIRLRGDFDPAEEAMHEAFATAIFPITTWHIQHG